MNVRPIVLASVFWSILPACGDDGGSTEVDARTIDGPVADAPQPDASQPDAQEGAICGGKAGGTCPATQYCDYAQNGCGFDDGTGICVDRPIGCPDPVFQATCGCDGTVYGQPCDAYAAGTDLNAYGTCPVPPESFACGWTQCDRLSQYCRRTISDIGGEPDSFECIAMPPCPQPGCPCVVAEPCGNTCTGDLDTGVTVTCAGG
jgi:hypothetical protein